MQKTITINKKKVKIYYKDVYLNPILIRKQNLTIEKIKRILELHKDLLNLYANMKIFAIFNSKKELKKCSRRFHTIQFELQKHWGFEENIDYHKFWTLPGCNCPKLDNEDRYPHGYYIYNTKCLIHG